MALYDRLKAVCCRAWAMSPREFDAECDAGHVLLTDVLALVSVECMDAWRGQALAAWLCPGAAQRVEDAAKAKRQAAQLASILRLAKPADGQTAEVVEQLREEAIRRGR